MTQILDTIASTITGAEPRAKCMIDEWQNQIIVSFTNRPGVEVALLTPAQQREVKSGSVEADTLTELLFSIKRIANN